MAASLKDVIEQLQENREAQEETTQAVYDLDSRIAQLTKSMKIQSLDMLEVLRESAAASKKSAPAGAAAPTKGPTVKFKDDGLFANLPKKLPFLAGLGAIVGGLTIGAIGILRALGPAGVGIAAFFIGLAGASAIMNNFSKDGGGGLKSLLRNVAEGLESFGTKQFSAFGAVLAAGVIFPKRTGAGLALAGAGIGAFLSALAVSSGAATFLSGDKGESLKKLLTNIAGGLSVFGGKEFAALGVAMASGALLSFFPGGTKAASLGIASIGVGIGAFITALAGITDFGALLGIDGSGFKPMMANIAGGLKELSGIQTEGLLEKVKAIGLIGPAVVSAILGFGVAQGADFLIDSAKKVINFLTFGMAGLEDQATRRKGMIRDLVDALQPLKEIPDNLGAGLDKLGDSLVRFVTSFNTVGKKLDIKTFSDTFQELGHALATTRKLIFAMANGGEFKIPGFLAGLGRITGLGGKIDFGPEGGGGILAPTLKLDELINKIGQINLVLGNTNVAAAIPQGNTTSQQIQNSGFKSFGPPNMQILDQSSRTGDTINQNQAFVGNITPAHDAADPYVYYGSRRF